MQSRHFINESYEEIDDANRNPIFGYENLSLMTLEKAVESIEQSVPDVKDYVATAKRESKGRSTSLTEDETASIYLYSMPVTFFGCLNKALREKDRQALKPWFAYLKLFLHALEKLPSTNATIWRGVAGDVASVFSDGQKRIWWSVNSCSKNLGVVEMYLGQTGTVFAIDVINGKDISKYSTFSEEEEIVLMPGTHVSPKCQSLNFDNRFFLVHLKEEGKSKANTSQELEVVYEINPRSSAGFSIVNNFNNWFGSNVTHVANGYSLSENQWIYVCFHVEVLSLEKIRLAIKQQFNISMEDHWKDVTNYKLHKVMYRSVHKQQRSTSFEFLTIISQDRNG
ncbi:unnamed protein product [Adineta ricciae]|nr:unnamed protein product [Adineta ricciae]